MDLAEPTITFQGAASDVRSRLLAHGLAPQVLQDRFPWLADAMHDLRGARLSLSQWEQLVMEGAESLRRPWIAAEMPQEQRSHPKHLLVYLASSASTVREGLEAWAHLAGLHGDHDRVLVHTDGKRTSLSYALLDARFHSRLLVEYMVSRLWSLVQHLCESRSVPQAITFAHPAPEHADEVDSVFRAPIKFGAKFNSVIFDSALLARPVHSADPYLHALLYDAAVLMLARQEDAMHLSSKVVRVISAKMMEGAGCTAESVATELNLSLRQLRAQLDASGFSFRAILDEVRRQAAARLLMDRFDNAHIADYLGFSEPSAFQHAFRRWYGMSAGDYRERHGRTAVPAIPGPA